MDAGAEPFSFPDPSIFGSGEYARAPQLTRRVSQMIAEQEDFAHLRGQYIPVVWKSGKSRKLGQCEVVRRTLTAFVPRGALWVITVYYDMCRMFNFTAKQMDALLDHEIRHCGWTAAGLPEVVRHDVEEFFGTVQRFGLWFEDVRRFAELVGQVAEQAAETEQVDGEPEA